MLAGFNQLRNRFNSDESGSVLVLFSGAMFLLLISAGAAIDAARVFQTRTQLAQAIDSAALAAGRSLLDGRLSDDDVRKRAIDYLQANITHETRSRLFGTLDTLNIAIDRATGRVSITANVIVPMTVMKIAGVNEWIVPVKSETRFEQKDIELSLALDLTGSMRRNNRIEALKDATNNLVDILLPAAGTPNQVRIALAPYSSGVNAGGLSKIVTGNRDSGVCTFEREGNGSDLISEAAPQNGHYLLEASHSSMARQTTCPTANPIVPLTTDRRELKDAIGRFRASGYTAGHLGIQWAWFMVSDAWTSIFTGNSTPVAYGEQDTIKAVIVMTDGQFNTVRGDSRKPDLSADIARDMCNAMRDKDIWVFSVGFELNNDDARQVLRDCAGRNDRFFLADDSEALKASFKSIANQLNNLRLSQ
ncbi:MAG: VWA domain-containing protein [Hyphomicrobiaceae bacterium]